MKKLFIILAIALTPFFIGSCEEDSSDEGPDLTKDIVGTYTGDLSLTNSNGTSSVPDLTIKITKVDNSTIKLEPSGQEDTHTFNAKLSEANDGVGMAIEEQDVLGGKLIGYSEDSNNPDLHGGLVTESTDTDPFFYSIKVELSGYTEYRIFMGAPAK